MRILVVEDEEKLARFLKESLEAEFFAVDIAEDGETGSRLARLNDYDLVLLDNVLPGKTGMEVCRDIRDHGKRIPIIIISARGETSQKIDFLNAGADDYLTKPFALAELLARIRALLRRPSTEATSDALEVGTISIDPKSNTVMARRKKVYLTRKEFLLLQYFMQQPGVILSRGMILEHVWDMSVDIFSNTIESHVLSLRKKIGDTGKGRNRIITTIPGRGYRMEAH